MKKFVYTPQVQAFIQSASAGNQRAKIFDVTEDIISGSVSRRLDALSDATLVLQNKNDRYTGAIKIRPMDKIAIRLGRLGPSMLVFSGYVDNSPYYQLFPGPVTIQASCTLKLLHHSYFDPGLKYLQTFWKDKGWIYDNNSGSMTQIDKDFGNNDIKGSIGSILSITLQEIGGWNADNIAIGDLPPKFLSLMAKNATDSRLEQEAENAKTLNRLQLMFNIAKGGGTPKDVLDESYNPAVGNIKPEVLGRMLLNAGFTPKDAGNFLAIAKRESSLIVDAVGYNPIEAGGYLGGGTFDLGLFQVNSGHLGAQGQAGDPGVYSLFPDNPDAGKKAAKKQNRIDHLDADIQLKLRAMFDPKANVARARRLFESSVNTNNGDGYYPWRLDGVWDRNCDLEWGKVTIDIVVANPNDFVYKPSASSTTTTTKAESPKQGTKTTIATEIIKTADLEAINAEVAKYRKYLGLSQDQPWIAAYIAWVFGKAGKDVRNPLRKATTSGQVYNAFKGDVVPPKQASAGDIVIFDSSAANQNDKIGIVIERQVGVFLGGAVGPIVQGGDSILTKALTHATSGIELYPAFDDVFTEGASIIAPEDITCTQSSSSNPGEAFYADGVSGLRYWFGHLDRTHQPGVKFKKGESVGLVGPNNIGGGPHVHVGVNVEKILGVGKQLIHHTNYTTGAPIMSAQLNLKTSSSEEQDGIVVIEATNKGTKPVKVIYKDFSSWGQYRFIHVSGIGKADPTAVTSNFPSTANEASTGELAGTYTDEQIFDIATQASAYFVRALNLGGNDEQLSQVLRGKRALANDVALIEWIKSMVQSSGRRYCSLPDGTFYAFFPDYFGWYKKTPYFRIADIEIIDLNIQRDDKEMTTHVFTWGNSFKWNASMPLADAPRVQVASVEETDFRKFMGINPDDPLNPADSLDDAEGVQKFLERYGARPKREDKLDIRIPEMLWMSAWTLFLKKWSEQFTTNATFTFLPEILPGGLVNISDKITMFVESVTHNFDRASGFTTTAQLTSPARIVDGKHQTEFGDLVVSSPDFFNEDLVKNRPGVGYKDPNGDHSHDRPGRGD